MNLARIPVFALGLTAWLLGGCAAPTSSSTSALTESGERTVLRVGIAPVLPPLAFKSGGDYQGVEPTLARALAADMGRTVEFVELPWEKLIDALLDDRVDILMSGMTITPARLMRVNFSQPYFKAGQTMLVRRTDAAAISMSLFDTKTRVGAKKATTGDFWAKQQCARNERKLYPTADMGARGLINGQIDVFICDAPVNWWLASQYEAEGLTVAGGFLTEEYLGWAIRKQDADLLAAANRFIEENRDTGQLRALISSWIPFD